MKKYLNGKLVELTSEEIAEHNALCSEAAAYEKEFREKINRKKEKKESAIKKLSSKKPKVIAFFGSLYLVGKILSLN